MKRLIFYGFLNLNCLALAFFLHPGGWLETGAKILWFWSLLALMAYSGEEPKQTNNFPTRPAI